MTEDDRAELTALREDLALVAAYLAMLAQHVAPAVAHQIVRGVERRRLSRCRDVVIAETYLPATGPETPKD